MIRGTVDHDLNVVGALVVALGDRMRDATEDAAGMGGAFPAALVALHEWAGGRDDRHARGRPAAEPLAHRARDRPPGGRGARGAARATRRDGRGVLVAPDAGGARAPGSRVLDARATRAGGACDSLGRGDARASWP